jgi:hypothetical protein
MSIARPLYPQTAFTTSLAMQIGDALMRNSTVFENMYVPVLMTRHARGQMGAGLRLGVAQGRRRRPGLHTSKFKIHSNPLFTRDRRRQANKISRVNWQSMQAASASPCSDHAAELRNWFVDHFYCGVASAMPPLSDATLQSADALELLQRVRAMHQGRLRERALLTADAQSRARLYAFEGNSIFVSQQSIGQRQRIFKF